MLATNIGTGLVVGQFGMGVVDGPDLDHEPEVIPLAGSVTFTPSIPYLPNQTADPNPITIVTAPIKGILDVEGYLCTPAADGVTPMYRGIRLFATDDPDASVQNWTYSVTYRFNVVNGATPAMKEHSMALPEGAEVDLTSVAEVPSSPGIGTPQALALLAEAEAAASEAADHAAVALQVKADADAGLFDGAEGPAGPNTVPTAEFVAGEISNPASPVAAALNAAISPKVAPKLDKTEAAETYATSARTAALETAKVTIDNTVGRRAFAWDAANARQQMIYGDTGIRVLGNDPASTTEGVGYVKLRRIGHNVELFISDKVAAVAGNPLTLVTLPPGFRPYDWINESMSTVYDTPIKGLQIQNTGAVLVFSISAGDTMRGHSTWTTTEAWPTSLPGTAQGAPT